MTKSVITIIAATVTIVFLTFFMLLEGQSWVDRVFSLLPERSQARWRRVGDDIYKTVGGYVTGNILISLIAGASITIVLLVMGVPYAVALGLLVAFLDLIPLAGATVAGIIVAVVAFLHSVPAGIVAVAVLRRLPADREPLPAARDLRPDGAALAARRARLGARRGRARRHHRRARGDPGRGDDSGDRARPVRPPPRRRARAPSRLSLRLGRSRAPGRWPVRLMWLPEDLSILLRWPESQSLQRSSSSPPRLWLRLLFRRAGRPLVARLRSGRAGQHGPGRASPRTAEGERAPDRLGGAALAGDGGRRLLRARVRRRHARSGSGSRAGTARSTTVPGRWARTCCGRRQTSAPPAP